MRNPKTLLNSVTRWKNQVATRDYRATIVVMGWAQNPCEPLLLEALANHPGCKHLYFVPIDGVPGELNKRAIDHDLISYFEAIEDDPERLEKFEDHFKDFLEILVEPAELLVYDLTALLHRRGGPSRGPERIDATLQAHFNEDTVVPLSTDDIDIYLSGHGQHLSDAFVARRNSRMTLFGNNPGYTTMFDHKSWVPVISRFTYEKSGVDPAPACFPVRTRDEVRAFMDQHQFNEIVLKEPDNACGHGIYRVFRDIADGALMAEYPDKSWEGEAEDRIFALDEDFFEGHAMLAMEWLDNSKGDIRAIIANGTCVGAYTRHHADDTWLCNYAQGGSIHPVDMRRDLSATDRKKLNALAKTLQTFGLNHVSVDLLANSKGERFLSEINIGNTDDIIEIAKFGDAANATKGNLSYADQIVADLMLDYRHTVERREQIAHATEQGKDSIAF